MRTNVFRRTSKENPRREIRVWRSADDSWDVRVAIGSPTGPQKQAVAVVVLDPTDVDALIRALEQEAAAATDALVFS